MTQKWHKLYMVYALNLNDYIYFLYSMSSKQASNLSSLSSIPYKRAPGLKLCTGVCGFHSKWYGAPETILCSLKILTIGGSTFTCSRIDCLRVIFATTHCNLTIDTLVLCVCWYCQQFLSDFGSLCHKRMQNSQKVEL